VNARSDLPFVRQTLRLLPADGMGLALHVRHVAPAGPNRGTVMLVHGATLASGLWDIAVPGYSVMEALALAGFSAWALDVRGYARSDRIAAPGAAYAGRDEAVRDIAHAVEFACQHDQREQVLLVGGSWGSITSALYATRQPQRVAALALMAPLFAAVNLPWLRDLAEPHNRLQRRDDLGPTRRVDKSQLLLRWDAEIPHGATERRRDPAVLDALVHDALGAEVAAAGHFVVPNGTLHDLFEVFSGRPLYDPAALRMPLLLLRGEHDLTATDADARRLFEAVGSDDKQYLQIGGAGHFVCAERQASTFQRVVIGFAAHTLSPR
jgi:alpha-beta hydrolase superfamily lysophospholipase